MLSSKNDSKYSPTPDRPCLLANGSGTLRFACTRSQNHDTTADESTMLNVCKKLDHRPVFLYDIALPTASKANTVDMKVST